MPDLPRPLPSLLRNTQLNISLHGISRQHQPQRNPTHPLPKVLSPTLTHAPNKSGDLIFRWGSASKNPNKREKHGEFIAGACLWHLTCKCYGFIQYVSKVGVITSEYFYCRVGAAPFTTRELSRSLYRPLFCTHRRTCTYA